MRVQGKALVVDRAADLTGACIKCSNPNAPHERVVDLSFIPPATYLTLLLSLPAFIIFALIFRKRANVLVSLCDTCHEAWGHSRIMGALSGLSLIGSTVGGVCLMAAGATAAGTLMLVGGPIMAVGGMIVAARRRLHASRISQTQATLVGVSPGYLQQMQYKMLPPGQTPSPH